MNTRHMMKTLKTLLSLLILGVLLALSGTDAQSASVRFAVIGDYGFAGQPEADVANLVKSWNPDFIITVGDNNYPSGAVSTIDNNIGQYYHDFISPYLGLWGPGATINRFFPSLGNHDWATTGAQPYLDYFTLPNNERYYDVVWGPVHLFAIDSDPNEPDGVTSISVQAGWLQGELAASTACWKLVYMHHPPYSSGSTHGSSTWMQWPYQSWGASVVLAGHDHDYERIIQGGFPYFINGLGGRSIYSFGTPVSGSQVRYNGDYGAMLVDADEAGITFQFMSRTGTLIDTYTSTASHCVLAAPTNLTAKAVSISRIDLAWTDNAGNEDGFSIEQSLNGTSFTQIGRVGANVKTYSATGLSPSITYYYRVRAYNNASSSAYSNTVRVRTKRR